MTLKSGTGQACAACKYQRRRCTPECLLAPFFPADQPKAFQNVHRLFGVKNIQNLLKELSPEQKSSAMQSIKYHAMMRDRHPVHGCMIEIQQLNYQIQFCQEELQAVLQQLAFYRQQQQHHHHQPDITATTEYLSELQLGMAPPGNNNPSQFVTELPVGPSYSNSGNGDYGMNYLQESNAVDSFCQYTNSNDDHKMVMQSHMITAQQPMAVQQQTMAHEYNEMQPFFDHIDDTQQSYIDSKEVYESSLESPLKDSRQLVEEMDENELKSAAACFSLTSVN